MPNQQQEKAIKAGLTANEYERAKALLGREANTEELEIFGMLWNDLYCYKNSVKWLRTLPSFSKDTAFEDGREKFGVFELEDGKSFYFRVDTMRLENVKAESISQSAPYGMQPLASFTALHSSPPGGKSSQDKINAILRETVETSKQLGFETLENEFNFNFSYDGAGFANIFSLGLFEGKPSKPDEKLNIYLLGKQGFNVEAAAENIQIFHKIVKTGLADSVFAIEAGGILAKLVDSAWSLKLGVSINFQAVKDFFKEDTLTQTLMSAKAGYYYALVTEAMQATFEKEAAQNGFKTAMVGETIQSQQLIVKEEGATKVDIPISALSIGGMAPVNELDASMPDYITANAEYSIHDIAEPDLKEVAQFIISHPNIGIKSSRNEQGQKNFLYDAEVFSFDESEKGLAAVVNSRTDYIVADPLKGSSITLAEAARKITSTGATPVASVCSFVFGDENNKEVYWQFMQSVRGIASAARRLNTPLIGGNVVFDKKVKTPTVIVSMLGVHPEPQKAIDIAFKSKGDLIFLVGQTINDIGSSEYLINYHEVENSPAPYFDIEFENAMQHALNGAIASGLVSSAHNVATGGLFASLFESCIPKSLGFDIVTDSEIREDSFLFGENQSRVLVSVSPANESAFVDFMLETGIPVLMLGHVTKGEMRIDDASYGFVAEAHKIYDSIFTDYRIS